MIIQLSVLFLMTVILAAGTSLRRFAVEGHGCKECGCGSDNCCGEEKKEE
ncbi:hypothetical protein C8C77_101133 [Halanaerobium saccharolyticum]|uniref:Uncharacterized protein n=1 Tax=Halanaerobium saccharolyticum TaxID=43595 RepID=A0A4R7Z9J9_9FIRM|nr:hypothetical protein [Halanaerobium saccharolyticum]RAK11820.1 hypothetical protein C7958_102133 [Halanaerobium saccharolyticum]TDW07661.1 hypothetical protein C8C77_101133 [Halanaerobium saccharolyticum]TDX64582.1 hypothetical protein C7956_101133 [Halanaerobium saccharolyticum]